MNRRTFLASLAALCGLKPGKAKAVSVPPWFKMQEKAKTVITGCKPARIVTLEWLTASPSVSRFLGERRIIWLWSDREPLAKASETK